MVTVTAVTLFCAIVFSGYPGIRCKSKVRHFPTNFKFGAATAAYQVEGGWDEDDKSPSIWDELTHSPSSPIKDGSSGDIAADSYHQYKKDVQIAKELGLDFYRFSISWTRILPQGFANYINEAGIQYYNNLINELLANNIQPMATMYHWDLPVTLQKLGGWTNSEIQTWFTDYSQVLYKNFGDRVKQWVTINEPKQICYEGYGSTQKAPVLNHTGIAEYMCAKNILLAHAKSYHLYNDHYRGLQNGSVGISVSCTWYEPFSETADDQQAAEDARQFDWGQYTHPIFSAKGDFPDELIRNIAVKSIEQGYRRSRLPVLTSAEVKLIRGSSDFFGMNTYTSKMAYRDASLEGLYPVPSYMDDMGAVIADKSTWPQAQSSWLRAVPWGFFKLLTKVKSLYSNPPVIVTENGWSTSGGLLDDDRVMYYRNYLKALLDAIGEGCDVRGYTAWSLMDNFEWMAGYTERFGLFEVDFTYKDRPRMARKSAYVYKEIIRTRSLDLQYDPADSMVLSKEIAKKKARKEVVDHLAALGY